jgi:hypothetical protein
MWLKLSLLREYQLDIFADFIYHAFGIGKSRVLEDPQRLGDVAFACLFYGLYGCPYFLDRKFLFKYRQANNLETGIISWSPLFGVVLVTLAAIIVFFNQYFVKRMHDKMYMQEQPVEALSETPQSIGKIFNL